LRDPVQQQDFTIGFGMFLKQANVTIAEINIVFNVFVEELPS